jgi:hypothetical protein
MVRLKEHQKASRTEANLADLMAHHLVPLKVRKMVEKTVLRMAPWIKMAYQMGLKMADPMEYLMVCQMVFLMEQVTEAQKA